MLAPFLIMLREGLEAALLTSIIASYLNKTGRSSYMPAVWVGIFLAIALSFLAGAALQIISAEFPQKMQELFEAVVGFVAVIVLMSMVLWMKKAARSLKDELQHSVEHALAAKSATWALIGMVFFSVAREGLESVFFLLAIFQQSEGYAAPLGAFFRNCRIRCPRFPDLSRRLTSQSASVFPLHGYPDYFRCSRSAFRRLAQFA